MASGKFLRGSYRIASRYYQGLTSVLHTGDRSRRSWADQTKGADMISKKAKMVGATVVLAAAGFGITTVASA
ncbi:MAG: hypothetical protein ACO4AZ_00745, partial [Ilumatobacteraceae bacterium]